VVASMIPRMIGNSVFSGRTRFSVSTDQDGKRESASIVSKEPESELVCGTLGKIGQRRMSVEVDPVWRIFAAASIVTRY